jgi:hypothetical protein
MNVQVDFKLTAIIATQLLYLNFVTCHDAQLTTKYIRINCFNLYKIV